MHTGLKLKFSFKCTILEEAPMLRIKSRSHLRSPPCPAQSGLRSELTVRTGQELHAEFGTVRTRNSACPNELCGFVLALLRFVTHCPSATLVKLLWQLLKVCRCPQTHSTASGARGGGRFCVCMGKADAYYCQTLLCSWASVFKFTTWG